MRESGYSARAGFKDFDRGQIYGRPSYRGIKDLSVDQGFPNLSLSPGLSYPDGFFLLGGMKAGTVAKGEGLHSQISILRSLFGCWTNHKSEGRAFYPKKEIGS